MGRRVTWTAEARDKGRAMSALACGERGRMDTCFFFQAEDGIRDTSVTGVQTCALPISIGGEPTNDRPIIVQQTGNSIRIGAQQGHPVGAPQTTPQDTKPHAQMEAVPPEDVFLVYDGSRGPRPDGTPVWHYMAKNGLRSPGVPAVAEFRKIIEAAEKEQKGKP